MLYASCQSGQYIAPICLNQFIQNDIKWIKVLPTKKFHLYLDVAVSLLQRGFQTKFKFLTVDY